MDPIKHLYINILTVLSVLLLGCFFESVAKKSRLSLSLAGISLSSLLSIIFFVSTILTKQSEFATIFYLCYFSMLDISAMSVLFLVFAMEEKSSITKGDFIVCFAIICVCLLDIFFMFFYGITKFEIIPVYRNNRFYTWQFIYYKPYFLVHEILTHLVFFLIVLRFLRDAFKTIMFYRIKYLVVLILIIVVVALNAYYISNPNRWNLDFSLIAYGIAAVIIFGSVIHVIPRIVRQHMLAIANETISDAVICFDNNEEFIYANKLARDIYKGPETGWLQEYIYDPRDFIRETLILQVGDEDRVFDLEFHRMRDAKDRYSGSYFKLNDRTEEVKKIEKEEYRASHDELTGLYNRNYFFNEMEKMLHAKPDVPRNLISTDIVNFKLINDIFGSSFGDQILKKQAEMLRHAEASGAIIGRISGDRFAMIIDRRKFNPEIAVKNTKAISDMSKNIKFPFKVKIGVYEIANSFENVHTMYDKANMAVKNSDDTLNQIINYYDISLMNKLIHEKNIIGEFKYAIKSNQFFMFLQPQISSKTNKCIGAEALVRWYDIDKGYRQPGEFISILENSGLIYKLDFYIWEKAIQTLKKWNDAGNTDMYISVNISARDFYFADLYKVFTGLVEQYDVSPKRVNLEITESVLIDNPVLHKSILKKLQDYGFSVEMDDFGSGYSSLNVLKEISMDVLKIDMGFLRVSKNEERGQLIIQSVVKMAHSLGMDVICEGVETEDQKDFLTSVGVDIFQGYYFSKPISLQDFEHKYMEEINNV